MTADQKPAAGLKPDQTQLALERTMLAHERTLMAWIRTATSLITFGFALYQFFIYIHQQKGAAPAPTQLLGARHFGLIMIVIGLFTLAIASWQHWQQIRMLRKAYPTAPFSLSLVVAALIATLGILALIGALAR